MNSINHWGRLGLLLGLLAASACSPDTPPQSAAQRADGTVDAQGHLSYAPGDFHEVAPGKPGGVLRVSAALDPGTFDMHASYHGNMQWLGRILFDCLLYQDEQGNIAPWLAKSWDISPDGKTYTFHLRDDVTFSDGAKFNAEALRINLEHMRDPATKSPLAAAYIAPYVDGRIVDEYTFEAHLREPYSPFLYVLAQSWLSMISPRQILQAPKSIAEHPIGSGPFVLQRYTRDQVAVFTRRADYHWAPAVTRHQGPAYLDGIELSIVPEAMTRYSTLESRRSDFTLDAPPQNTRAMRESGELVVRNRIRMASPYRSVTFNTERFPFDDVRVRKAIAQAIDRDGLAWIVGFGEFVPKSDYLAANTPYYDPTYRDALKYDPQAANHLLDEAGWTERDSAGYRVKNGRRLSASLLGYESPAFPSSLAVAIQADVKKVGMAISIEMLPLTQLADRRMAGKYEAIGGGYWHTNTPDGLFILYHSDSRSTPRAIGNNVSNLSDPLLDRLLSEARRSHDPVQLQTLYSAAQQRLTELVPAVPDFESQVLIAYRKPVSGLIFDAVHNTPFFTSVWLDQETP